MAALLDVSLRSAEPANEKVAQPLLGACEIVRWIHGREDLVAGNLPVERRNEARESLFSDNCVNILIVDHSVPESDTDRTLDCRP